MNFFLVELYRSNLLVKGESKCTKSDREIKEVLEDVWLLTIR